MEIEVETKGQTAISSTFDFTDCDVGVRYSQNETEVSCFVYGPTELPFSKRDNKQLTVTMHYFRENGAQEVCHELDDFVVSMISCQKYPRAGLVMNVHQLRDDGSRFSTALNAASLALLDSSVQLESLLAAVDVALINDDYVVNPNASQEAGATGSATLIFKQTADGPTVTGFHSKGPLGVHFFTKAKTAAMGAAEEVFTYFRSAMQTRLRSMNTN